VTTPGFIPLPGCLAELLPWIKRGHNEVDTEFDQGMGDYFDGFLQAEARRPDWSVGEIRAWQPPAPARRLRG
jgi:hypothetical protein